MSRILHTRCRNHPGREAAARCVTCGGFFCRECITEHHERMICARCLVPAAQRGRGRRLFSAVVAMLRLAAGVLILWCTFYNLGRFLIFVHSRSDLLSLPGLPFSER
jgi:hypothetical protein